MSTFRRSSYELEWIRQIISKFNSKSWIKTVLVATSLTSFSFRAERRKYTNAPTLCRLWPSVDDDDGDYTLAPPGHIAIAIEVQWLQSTARVREKTWRFLVTSPLGLPQILPAFRKNPIQFFCKVINSSWGVIGSKTWQNMNICAWMHEFQSEHHSIQSPDQN